jgi:hypothetical protein
VRAADPSNIIWENLKHRSFERFIRKLFIALISLILMVGSFVAIIMAKDYSSAKASEYSAGVCAD